MAVEGEVQLNQEGTGPKVRTLKLTDPSAVSTTGAAQTDDARHQQIVTLADRRGDLTDIQLLESVLVELRAIRESLSLLVAQID